MEFGTDHPDDEDGDGTETEMRLADVQLPGVYHVSESGGGYTTEYIAQELQSRQMDDLAAARFAEGGGGTAGGGGGTPTQRTGGGHVTPVTQWTDTDGDGLDDTTGQPLPQVRTVNMLNERVGSGESLENVHATGSGMHTLRASGNGWAIRNVGVNEVTNPGADGRWVWFAAQGNGIIEHCHINCRRYNSMQAIPGVYIPPAHSGHILIRFCYFHGGQVYGSPPGNDPSHPSPGSGGTVTIENCFAENAYVAGYRLGTDGSSVRNSVAKDSTRGYWGYYNDTKLINCDIAGGIGSGESKWPSGRNATVTLENTRFSGGTSGPGDVIGQSAGQPNLAPPERVPLDAKTAAEGRYYSNPPTG